MKTNPSAKGWQILEKYLPSESVPLIHELLTQHPLDFKVTKPRRTKLGDFRHQNQRERPEITVNGNLNPYSFFVTTVHELAHFYAFKQFGSRIEPHGQEWKNTYRELLIPFFTMDFLPSDVLKALQTHIKKISASSCTDLQLYKTLRKYDPEDQKMYLDELNMGRAFVLNERIFIKGVKRRKNFECIEKSTHRKFIVSSLARVNPVFE